MVDEKTTVGLPVGTKIGKYEVRERLGMGGQAIVYRCHDSLLDRDLAVKQVSSHLAEDPKFMARFRREAQILAKLGTQQPAIVTIHELVEDERGLFIVMEYVQGLSLEAILRQNGDPFDPKAALQIVWRLAAALNTVHNAGIIHRDIKPGNVIIADGLKPKITDFGVASAMAAQASMPLGTTKYMAPELFEGGQVDGRADLYSLGFIAYEMLIGRSKFNEVFADVVRDPQSEVVRWMKWHGNRLVQAPMAHEVNPSVPRGLSEIVARMMVKDPSGRYAGMEELGRAIKETFSARAKLAAQPTGAQARPAPAAGTGSGLEAEDLEIQVNGAPRAAAPRSPGPGRGQGEEGPATAPIPRKKLSRKAKRILLAAAGGAVLVGVIVAVLVASHMSRTSANARKTLYDNSYKAYETALRDNNKAKFHEADDGFADVMQRFPGTKEAAMSSVMTRICQAYQAVIAQDWEKAAQAKRLSVERLNEVQAAWDGATKWVRDKKAELDETFEYHLVESRRFAGNMKVAEALMSSVVAMDEAYKEAGKPEEDVRRVTRAKELVAAQVKQAADEVAREHLQGTEEALARAEEELRKVTGENPAEEVHDILTQAKLKIVRLARKMLVKRIEESARTPQQFEATADFRSRVAAAEAEVDKELARRNMLIEQQKKDAWTKKVEDLKSAAEAAMKRGRDLAAQGKLDEAKEAIKDANKAISTLADMPLPEDISDRGRRELKDVHKNTMAVLNSAIADAGGMVEVAYNNWQKQAKYDEAIENAKKADNWTDKYKFLREAVAARPEARKELAEQLRQADMGARAERAAKLLDEGRVSDALAAVNAILARDPGNELALKVKARCEGLQKWAALIQEGDDLVARKKWADALGRYQQADSIKPEPILAEKVTECKYQVGLAEAGALREQGKYDEALATLAKLKEVKPSAAPLVDSRILEIQKDRDAAKLCDAGDEALKGRDWDAARKKFTEARKLDPSGPLRQRATLGQRKAIGGDYRAKGEAQMAQGAYQAALAYLKNALNYADEKQEKKDLQEMIDTCEKNLPTP